MSGTMVERAPASTRQLVRSDAMDTSQMTSVPATGFESWADERALGMENLLMIESGPLPEVPDELHLVRVPEPVIVLTTMLSGQTQALYPFPIDSPPTWKVFLRVIQSTICSNIKEELGDAQVQIELLVEQTRAQRDLLLQANGHMASQMQAMEERMRGYFSAVQSESRELLEQAVISLKAPLLAIPRWDRALQEAMRNPQYTLNTLRPASRVRRRSQSRNRLAGSGQIPSTRDRAKQANRVRRRNTIVPATSPLLLNLIAEHAPALAPATALATETQPQAASNASVQEENDCKEEDFLESRTGIPEWKGAGQKPLSQTFLTNRRTLWMRSTGTVYLLMPEIGIACPLDFQSRIKAPPPMR